MRGERPRHRRAGALAGRVEHDDVGAAERGRHELGASPRPGSTSQVGEPGAVVPRVGAGAGVALDGEDRALGACRLGQRDGEEPGTGVEVDDPRAAAVADHGEDRMEQRRRGAGVDLPEDARRDAVGAPAHHGVHGAGGRTTFPRTTSPVPVPRPSGRRGRRGRGA